MRYFSYSQINSFRRCQKQWAYRYIQRLEPTETAKPLEVGSMMHELVKGWWLGRDLEPILKEWLDGAVAFYAENELGYDSWIEERYNLVAWLMDRYVRQYEAQRGSVEILGTEIPFSTSLPHPEGKPSRFGLHGFVDLMFRDAHGRIWGMEIKTMGRWGPEETLDTDDQISTYIYGLRRAKSPIPVYGFVWEGILTYRWKGPRPVGDSFKRVWIDRPEEQLATFAQDAYMTCQEIVLSGRKLWTPRTINHQGPRACANCTFFLPCQESILGDLGDEEAVIDEGFRSER